MPKETFWDAAAVDGDGVSEPVVTIAWGGAVFVNGSQFDRSGINRMIRSLRRARDATFGADE